MKRFLRNSLAAIIFITPAYVAASDTPAVLFLREAEPSTRLFSMGSILSSLDPGDLFSRPWSLTPGRGSSAAFSRWPGIVDGSAFSFVGIALSLSERDVLSLSTLQYGAGDEVMYEFDGSSRRIRVEENMLAWAGYGRTLSDRFTAGINVKYLSSVLAQSYKGTSLLGDLGLMYHSDEYAHNVALALKNYGQTITFYKTAESLPAEVAAGYTGQYKTGEGDRYVYGLSVAHLIPDSQYSVSGGIAYHPWNTPFLMQGGVRYSDESLHYTIGMGVAYNGFELDLGYGFSGIKVKNSEFPIRVSLSWSWGGENRGSSRRTTGLERTGNSWFPDNFR